MAATAETARRLTLAWGIHSVPITPLESMDEMSAFACEVAEREGFASKGDTIVIAAGTPIGVPGTTNALKIMQV
jgi:pyruvate kinase